MINYLRTLTSSDFGEISSLILNCMIHKLSLNVLSILQRLHQLRFVKI